MQFTRLKQTALRHGGELAENCYLYLSALQSCGISIFGSPSTGCLLSAAMHGLLAQTECVRMETWASFHHHLRTICCPAHKTIHGSGSKIEFKHTFPLTSGQLSSVSTSLCASVTLE